MHQYDEDQHKCPAGCFVRRPAHDLSVPLRATDTSFTFCKLMSLQGEDRLEIEWDPPGLWGGVLMRRRIAGQWYEWRIPANGLIGQAMAADLLGVSKMSVNNWVRDKKIAEVKIPGHPSAIPLREVKRIKKVLATRRRLPRDWTCAPESIWK